MPTYKIPITCEMCGEYEIEADSMQEALDKYHADGHMWSLPELNYVDSSERLEHELIGLVNHEILTPEEKVIFNA